MNKHLPLSYWVYNEAFIEQYEQRLAEELDPKARETLYMNLNGLLKNKIFMDTIQPIKLC